MNNWEKQERKFAIYEELLKLKAVNDRSLKDYREYIEKLAEEESSEPFFQGSDDSPEEKRIQELEEELKTLL